MKTFGIGIQLHTLREELDRDFAGTLRELARLGCDGLEFAFRFGGLEPAELAALLRELGLKCCGMHILNTKLDDPLSWAYAEALKAPFLTISHKGPFDEKFDELLTLCRTGGKLAAAHGLQFTYHNHAGEFQPVEGRLPFERLMAETDPRAVQAELDVYWIARAGLDPVDYIRKYAGRLPQLHLKDMDGADGSFTELGNGTVDLAACVEAARDTICEWLIYEQDVCKCPPFESAVVSLEYLKKLLGR